VLLLIVDDLDYSKHESKLSNTNSNDSNEIKNKQIVDNLINNSRVLYNSLINNKEYNTFENDFYYIHEIEYNAYNENEYVTCKLFMKRKTINDFNNYIISKNGDKRLASLELDNVIDEIVKDYLEKQQQTTTMILEFNGRIPNKFILKRLKKIAIEVEDEGSVIFSDKRIKQIIKMTLNPVDRTLQNYIDSLVNFSKQNGKPIMGFDFKKYNLRGFSDTVDRLLE
jgi:hypothetical protein